MILLFQNWQGDLRVISNPFTKDEVLKDIRKFCNERNYEIPYIRFWDKQLEDGTKKRTLMWAVIMSFSYWRMLIK